MSDSGVLEGEKARKEVDTGERNCQPGWPLCSGSSSEARGQPVASKSGSYDPSHPHHVCGRESQSF